MIKGILYGILISMQLGVDVNRIQNYFENRWIQSEEVVERYNLDNSKLWIVEKVYDYSMRFNLNFKMMVRLIYRESKFDKDAVSNKGAIGLGQVMKNTAESVAGFIGIEKYDLRNADDNLLLSFKYFSMLLKWSDSVEEALARYYSGNSWKEYVNSDYVVYIKGG